MELEKEPLLAQLERFEFSPPQAVLTFERRLARENGWTPAYAVRVVTEYRRFLFLALRAGHPVTPSEAVDQAWHLHLVYTESYWNDLCRDLLGQPLHHGPTRGGSGEQAKYEDWYERTLASYRRLFRAEPPRDIWPEAAERFGEAPFHQRVNLRRNWVIPRPEVWRRLVRRVRRVGTEMRAGRGIRESTWLGAVLATAVVAGCAAGGGNDWGVFDWYGPPFLGFFLILSILLIGLAYYFRRQAMAGEGTAEVVDASEWDPYALAFLAGGQNSAIQAAVVALRERGLVTLEGDRPVRLAPVVMQLPRELPAFERMVMSEVHGSPTVPELKKSLQGPATDWESSLVGAGLMISAEARQRLKIIGGLLLTVGLSVGALKVYIGLQRDRPVLFLVMLMVALFIALVVMTQKLPRWTGRGKGLLARLREEYQQFSSNCLKHIRQAGAPVESGVAALSFLPLVVGLYGLDALGDAGELQAYHRLWPRGTTGSGSGSDGGSGCGTSSGDGGGGGDGGGSGCGGCGGGGD